MTITDQRHLSAYEIQPGLYGGFVVLNGPPLDMSSGRPRPFAFGGSLHECLDYLRAKLGPTPPTPPTK